MLSSSKLTATSASFLTKQFRFNSWTSWRVTSLVILHFSILTSSKFDGKNLVKITYIRLRDWRPNSFLRKTNFLRTYRFNAPSRILAKSSSIRPLLSRYMESMISSLMLQATPIPLAIPGPTPISAR